MKSDKQSVMNKNKNYICSEKNVAPSPNLTFLDPRLHILYSGVLSLFERQWEYDFFTNLRPRYMVINILTCIDNHIIFYMIKKCQRGKGLTGNTNSLKQKIWPNYRTFISHRPKCT